MRRAVVLSQLLLCAAVLASSGTSVFAQDKHQGLVAQKFAADERLSRAGYVSEDDVPGVYEFSSLEEAQARSQELLDAGLNDGNRNEFLAAVRFETDLRGGAA